MKWLQCTIAWLVVLGGLLTLVFTGLSMMGAYTEAQITGGMKTRDGYWVYDTQYRYLPFSNLKPTSFAYKEGLWFTYPDLKLVVGHPTNVLFAEQRRYNHNVSKCSCIDGKPCLCGPCLTDCRCGPSSDCKCPDCPCKKNLHETKE